MCRFEIRRPYRFWSVLLDGICSHRVRFVLVAEIQENEPPVGLDAMSLSDTLSEIGRLSDEQRDCIENCTEAAEVCEWCADECVGDEGMAECARLCRDVADVASLHARFMARDSTYSAQLAEACAGACEECADECERHDADHCRTCAEVLRECAESCRSMMDA